MRLEMLAKDEDSGRTGCPSVYIDENGWAVIQGPAVEPATGPDVAILPPGDTRIRIAPKVLIAAVEALKRRGHGETAECRPDRPCHSTATGTRVVRGPEVESETRLSLVNLLPGETGVRISTEVLTAAVVALQRP